MRTLMEVSESELKQPKPKPRRKTIRPFVDHSDPNIPGSYAWYRAKGKAYDDPNGSNFRGAYCGRCRANHEEGKCPNMKRKKKSELAAKRKKRKG